MSRVVYLDCRWGEHFGDPGDLREEDALLSNREAGDPTIRIDAEQETVRGGKAEVKARIHAQPYEHVT